MPLTALAVKDNDGKELSPCIVAKAKYALFIKNGYTINSKGCTKEYWNKVIDSMVKSHKEKIPKWQIKEAKGRSDLYNYRDVEKMLFEIESKMRLRFF